MSRPGSKERLPSKTRVEPPRPCATGPASARGARSTESQPSASAKGRASTRPGQGEAVEVREKEPVDVPVLDGLAVDVPDAAPPGSQGPPSWCRTKGASAKPSPSTSRLSCSRQWLP